MWAIASGVGTTEWNIAVVYQPLHLGEAQGAVALVDVCDLCGIGAAANEGKVRGEMSECSMTLKAVIQVIDLHEYKDAEFAWPTLDDLGLIREVDQANLEESDRRWELNPHGRAIAEAVIATANAIYDIGDLWTDAVPACAWNELVAERNRLRQSTALQGHHESPKGSDRL